jgi:hypothetical protein
LQGFRLTSIEKIVWFAELGLEFVVQGSFAGNLRFALLNRPIPHRPRNQAAEVVSLRNWRKLACLLALLSVAGATPIRWRR